MEDNSIAITKENLAKKNFLLKNKTKIINLKIFSFMNFKVKFIENNNIFIFKKNENNNNIQDNKIKKKRNAGIDLIRIIAMFNVILNHYIFHGGGFKHFPKYKRKLALLHCFTDLHINSFILIS